ncbi:MAG: hypothetical protein JNJ83_03820 [Verrucomicrobiaceae bacterium]|nr:hypothetical protein [Verrucomicrobiaceae bacterium]
MAKRRESTGDEVSLFPFLSILACLIGGLILMIVVMSVTTSEQGDGRTKEEIDRAKTYQVLLRELERREKLQKELEELLKKLAQYVEDKKQEEDKLANLRRLITSSADVQRQNEAMGQEALKKLDNLLLEIEGINKQAVETKKEIAALMEELKKRQIPPDKKPPPVVVQPSGTGEDAAQKLFFVEASGGKLAFTIDGQKKTVAATEEAIIGSAEFNHFLTEVKKAGNAQLIFLLRTDGTTAYNRGGGWAQEKYNIRISRLLLPGMGDVDLKLFGDRLGTVGPIPADFQPPQPATPKP